MRLLLDENLSPIIDTALTAVGYDVLAVVAARPGARDAEVVALALAEDRVIVSEDKDFGTLVFRGGLRPPGVIRLALIGYRPTAKAARLINVLAAEGTRALGALLVVEPTRTRLRPLP